MRFLITGFAPFGGSGSNPSYEAVKNLPGRLGDHEIHHAQLPVAYGRAGAELLRLIGEIGPDCVLCLGQAAGREGISLENTAVNVRASDAPDNDGVTCSGEKIDEAGPDSLAPSLPLREILAGLKESGIPAKISYSAGTYVCNDLFYTLLRYIEKEDPRLLGGFIHVPAEEAQAADFPPGTPLMPIADVTRAVMVAVAVVGEMHT